MMLKRIANRKAQAMVDYAILVSAALIAVMAVANLAYRSFVDTAQTVEREGMVF